jgi:hypothetical protein
MVVSISPCQLGAEALERVDQAGAAVALDLTRGPINELLPQRRLLAKICSVCRGHQHPGRPVLGARQHFLKHLQPGIAEGELAVSTLLRTMSLNRSWSR